MCGIAGKVYRDREHPADKELVVRMSEEIAHRGPDGDGLYAENNIALGFRRLAIIDRACGAQPMFNEDRTLAIVFNGEIYNFLDLRPRLEALGHTFRTHSDTETILHGYEQWGTKVVHELRGMFAFAIVDLRTGDLFAARDRVGKKPFFYSIVDPGGPDEAFVFASELRAILCDPRVPRKMRADSFIDYLRYQFVPDPHTILNDVHRLAPAHWLEWKNGKLRMEQYWQLEYEPKRNLTPDQAAAELRDAIEESVRLRLQSEVPLGCFLSSGIDSAAIAAYTAKHLPHPFTFCARIANDPKDEGVRAMEAAKAMGTNHIEIPINYNPVEDLHHMVRIVDEPNGKTTNFSFYYLYRDIAPYVKVVLSGEGGDESYCGYDRYFAGRTYRIEDVKRSPLRNLIPSCFPNSRYNISTEQTFIKQTSVAQNKHIMKLTSPDVWRLNTSSGAELLEHLTTSRPPHHRLDRFMRTDLMMHMASMTLPLTDRLSMAHGIEVRAPLLDHKLLDTINRLPVSLKLLNIGRKGLQKYALRNIVPRVSLETPKIGFGTIPRSWSQEQLPRLVNEYLLSPGSRTGSLYNSAHLRKMTEATSEGRNHRQRVWPLVTFEVWCREFKPDVDFV